MGGFKSLFYSFYTSERALGENVIESSGGGKEMKLLSQNAPSLPIGSWEREDRETALASPLNQTPRGNAVIMLLASLCLLADSLSAKKLI